MNEERKAAGLERVGAELQAWRERRRKGDRIPDEVWRQAGRAVHQYGLNPVSRALCLNYYQLKRWAGKVDGPGLRKDRPVFVEVEGAVGKGGMACLGEDTDRQACVVELEKGNGAWMRICVRDTVAVDWSKLKEAFLGA